MRKLPGIGNHVVQSPGWLPAKLSPRQLAVGDEDGRVAGPASTVDGRQWVSGDLADDIGHLQDTGADAGAEVVNQVLARPGCPEREKMRIGNIEYVDVVTDCGTVRRRVVGAEDVEHVAIACRDLQRDRDKVRLDSMALAVGV